MKQKNIDFSLLWRKLFGKLDPSEEQELERWLADNPRNQDHFKSLQAFHKKRPEIAAQSEEAAWERLQSKLNSPSASITNRQRSITLRYFYRAAAVFVIAAATVAMLWKYSPLFTDSRQAIVIKPGKPSATLITATGRTVQLGDSTIHPDMRGIPAQAGTSFITYHSENNNTPDEEINTLIVPRGGEFELTLEDGTHVWLNSESSIKFPTNFTGSRRTVLLTGEAYFEVTKNPNKPFEVITEGQTISVLGTSFNVSAYPQDAAIYTTLVEGSLRVSDQGGQSILVTPGNQSVYNFDSGQLTSRAVDTYVYTSWKNGLLIFDDEELGMILQRLGRWYNVDTRYEDALQEHTHFTVHIDKYQPITEVLQLIEITKAVDFELEKRTIIVQ
jgi:transmembrane sensor